jgi:hypothetical protein
MRNILYFIAAGILICIFNIHLIGIFVDEQGNPETEENFEEAIRAVTSSIKSTVVPSHVRDILEDDSCINLTSKVQVTFA